MALAAQLEQERREGKTWQKRVRELLDKTGKSVGQEAYKQLDKAREELQKQLDAALSEGASARAAKEKAEGENEELKKLEARLRQVGGKFKEKVRARERGSSRPCVPRHARIPTGTPSHGRVECAWRACMRR